LLQNYLLLVHQRLSNRPLLPLRQQEALLHLKQAADYQMFKHFFLV
jgi:hypothetical protein